jgi:ribonuclease P protein component
VADNSYSKNLRLLSAQDFSNLKVDSKLFKRNVMRIYYKSNERGLSRLGISISSKSTTAVLRNRIKRIIRNEFRHSEFKHFGFDFLCVLHQVPKDFDQDRFEQNLKKTLSDFFTRGFNA